MKDILPYGGCDGEKAEALLDRVEATLDMAAIGERIRQRRVGQGWSLEMLAAQAGVSRSMLSAVERGAKVPTIVVLHRIANGLGTNMTHLLGEEQTARVVMLRREEQDVVRDPAGWERRNLAPVWPGSDFEFMRTTIPAGVHAGEFPPHPAGSREYVAVERVTLLLTVAGTLYSLNAGDSIAYEADCLHAFASAGPDECVYYLALDVPERNLASRWLSHTGNTSSAGETKP
jgi:transcriptional regulator with XRE-family HTH domain